MHFKYWKNEPRIGLMTDFEARHDLENIEKLIAQRSRMKEALGELLGNVDTAIGDLERYRRRALTLLECME